MNRCVGCRWHTPKDFGGEGIQCHSSELTNSAGDTTKVHCPDWVIKWYINTVKPKGNWTMTQLVESNQL